MYRVRSLFWFCFIPALPAVVLAVVLGAILVRGQESDSPPAPTPTPLAPSDDDHLTRSQRIARDRILRYANDPSRVQFVEWGAPMPARFLPPCGSPADITFYVVRRERNAFGALRTHESLWFFYRGAFVQEMSPADPIYGHFKRVTYAPPEEAPAAPPDPAP